jgi:hypothetical protein
LGIEKIKFDAYGPEKKEKFKSLLQKAVPDMSLVPPLCRRFARIIARMRTVSYKMMTPSLGPDGQEDGRSAGPSNENGVDEH